MRSRILMLFTLALVLALPAFAAPALDAAQDQVAAEAPAAPALDAQELATELLVSLPASEQLMSVAETTPDLGKEPAAFDPFCNQGAWCNTRKDPVCGVDGYCNLPSHCCMCY